LKMVDKLVILLLIISIVTVVIAEECRHCNIEKLLSKYKAEHSIQILTNESSADLCQRKFVHNQLYCSSSKEANKIGIGTIWGSNLPNNFAISILLNRTFVVEFQMDDDCGGYIALADWVVTYDQIMALTKLRGCPLHGSKQIEPLLPCFQCHQDLNHTVNDRFIFMNPWYWQSVYNIYHPHNDGQLSASTRAIYNTLYSNPHSATAFEGAGILIEHALTFTKTLKNLVKSTIEPLRKKNSDFFSISMHLRHQDGGANLATSLDSNQYASYDSQFVKCFHEIRQRFAIHANSKKKCLLYVASDRPQSLLFVRNHSLVADCDVRAAPRATVSTAKEFNGEHGPWSGATSILDVYVLAHTDWFIGSRGSSYSLLINNLVMLNSVKKGRSDNPLYEVTMGAEGCKEVLPATASDNAYRNNPGICSSAKCAGK